MRSSSNTDSNLRYPTLIYSFFALAGAATSFSLYPLWLLPFILIPACILLFLKIQWQQLCVAVTIGLAAFTLTNYRYHFPNGQDSYTGIATVEIKSITPRKTPFGKVWSYQATLKSLTTPAKIVAKNIPISFTAPIDENSRLVAIHPYQIQAKIKEQSPHRFTLSPTKKASWIPLEASDLLFPAEWRFHAKTSTQDYIQRHISDRHVASFLSGIATGQFNNTQLAYELNRFGLQHLMAISGLHFSIIAMILGFLLSICMPQRIAALTVIILLSAYFIFLGPSPSVLRAWVAITFALLGTLMGRGSQGLNSLGMGLLLIIVWDPLMIESIGFQFSFGITASILLWFPICDGLMQKLFRKRALHEIVELGPFEHFGYYFLSLIRQALSLTIAVNLAALPLTLFYFHKFPMMGLIYNLFFPFMVSISMLLLMAAILTAPLPGLSQLFHAANEHYTHFLLSFAFDLPKGFDYVWYYKGLPPSLLALYLAILYIGGLVLREKTENNSLTPSWYSL